MKTIKLFPALLLLLAPVLATASDLQGDYNGLITGGGSESTTSFKSQGGKTTATYYMSKEKSSGTITDIQIKDQKLTGRWHDNFGKGYVLFIFSLDYESFQGCWDAKKIKDCRDNPKQWTGNKRLR